MMNQPQLNQKKSPQSRDVQNFNLIITCADGLEKPLLTELADFGLAGRFLRTGRVAITTDLAGLYHVCLYSRVASRVLLPLGEYHFKKKTHNENGVIKEVIADDVAQVLYDFAYRYDWTQLFGVDDTFAIRLSVDKKVAVNQQFATLRVKDAIADVFNQKLGSRPNVDKNPSFAIAVHVGSDCAEFSLDLSGTSLHRRGYRVANTAAPLKENLAAALLYECNWHKGEFDALIDPMCGSGTFVIEAMLMRANYPVGLDKASSAFGFYAWRHHDQDLWETLVANATQKFHDNLEKLKNNPMTVVAMDADVGAIRACHKNLLSSGLSDVMSCVQLEQRHLAQLPHVLANLSANNALIITNPPYGERLGDGDFIKPLYQGLGLLAIEGLKKATINKATLAVLASHVEHADTLPITNPQTLRCHNGALTVYFRHGQMNLTPLPSLIEQFQKREITSDNAQEFINRLQKNLSNLKKLAKKQSVTNLRVYDADLPNFNVAIDLYGDKIHVQEYAPPKQIPADVAKTRFNLVLSAVREVFDVSRESIFIKTRLRQSGNEQYRKNENSQKRKKMWVVGEHLAYFYVNFTDYLDTGLFIDHRNMRQLVAQASRGKHVLNLFAYTCSASVHAALGGAKSVTSVDLSANYLDWGRQNFALNGLDLSAYFEDELKYQFISADTFEWIKENSKQYDVIFIDPPTFSNSKKFKGTFDVQRDHVALISRAMNRLTADGVLYFSNNYTRFELDESLKQRYQVIDITQKTIGFDFDIKKPIHQSFEIRHKVGVVPMGNALTTAAPKNHKSINNKSVNNKTAKTPKHQPKTQGNIKKPSHFSDKQPVQVKTNVKRVYVNPKLADSDKLAQTLNEKLQQNLNELIQKRFKVKK